MAESLIAAALGIMLFSSAIVAPVVFTVLPAQWAGVYVRAFFPAYYATLGVVTGVAAVLTHHAQTRLLCATCALCFVFLLCVLTPMINKARDHVEPRNFNLYHRMSVAINLLQILILTVCLFKY